MDDDVEVENFEITDKGSDARTRKKTKEEAIYAMWADKDSGNDDGPVGYTGRRKKDYSKPINFVSGGIVQKGKDKKNTDDDDTGSIGSSASDKGTGSGRSSPVVKEKKLFKKTGIKKDASALGTQVFANKMHKTGKEFGSWEKYTKGFGMKMLQQMGYEPGKGLGKEGQGIVMPVEAFKRKGRGALGIYGPERSKKAQRVKLVFDVLNGFVANKIEQLRVS